MRMIMEEKISYKNGRKQHMIVKRVNEANYGGKEGSYQKRERKEDREGQRRSVELRIF